MVSHSNVAMRSTTGRHRPCTERKLKAMEPSGSGAELWLKTLPVFRCIRIVSRKIEFYNDLCDLSQLPWNIKTDLVYMNMRIKKGFPNEESFTRLLTSSVRSLIFKSTIVTDSMLLCIGKSCKNLHELFLSAGNYDFTADALCKCLSQMANLRVLQIVGSGELNEAVIGTIGRHCPKLRSLWINDCSNVNDSCAASIKSLELAELDVGNTQVRDEHLDRFY